MMLKIFFDITTGFRFSKISVECSVHLCSCPWIILKMCCSVNQIDDLQSSNKKQSWTFRLPWLLERNNTGKLKIEDRGWAESTHYSHQLKCVAKYQNNSHKLLIAFLILNPEQQIAYFGPPKGQLILKAIYGGLNSPQKNSIFFNQEILFVFWVN